MEHKGNTEVETFEPSAPTLEDIADALGGHVARNGMLRSGVARVIAAEEDWHGRVTDVLDILTEDTARMGYLTGGHKPEEVMTWLSVWVDSPFSLAEIRTIVESAGWDPDPFAVVVEHGLLERLVHHSDGSLRRIRGELAGAWLSDNFALADDEQILRAVRRVLDEK